MPCSVINTRQSVELVISIKNRLTDHYSYPICHHSQCWLSAATKKCSEATNFYSYCTPYSEPLKNS